MILHTAVTKGVQKPASCTNITIGWISPILPYQKACLVAQHFGKVRMDSGLTATRS